MVFVRGCVCVVPACTRTTEMSGRTDRERNGERSAALGGSWHLLFGERNVGMGESEQRTERAAWSASPGARFPSSPRYNTHQTAPNGTVFNKVCHALQKPATGSPIGHRKNTPGQAGA